LADVPANGLPAGGTAGQILTKVDATDYNATWQENFADWTSQVKHIVKNNGLSGTITKGTAVYVTSSNGTNILVGRASNASEPTSSKTMGLMQSDITTTGGNQTGFVITEGLLQGLNTASATAGDPVWLGVNGALIYGLTNKPYAPAHLVFIGIVTKISAGNGEIWVKVQNGFELKEIHDVDLITTTPINGHLLGFDGTLWVNKTIATWLGFTPFQLPALTSGSVLFSNGTTIAQDNAQLFWDDTNNRLGIGTNAPAYGLDVNGTARVSGIIYLTLGARIGTTTTTAGIFPSGTSGRESLNLRSSLLPTDTGNDVVITNGQGDVGNTSSIRSLLTVARSFAPTSGTGVYNLIQVNPTINQTGGANGITRGLYINPTLTAAADFRAIENSVGKVCLNTTSGNTMIGTSTDAGYRLDVNGTARVSGITTITPAALTGTAATSALDIAQTWNTTGNPTAIKLNITNTASGASANLMTLSVDGVERFKVNKVGGTTISSSLVVSGNYFGSGNIGTNFGGINNTANSNITSGINRYFLSAGQFIPTSGTGVNNGYEFSTTINQTGGANGITRGLYINPTLTAAADFRAIEVANGITILGASTTAKASLRIPSGTAPTTPTNGDIWFDGTDLKIRVAGVTRTIVLL
jgi:hypothetical protein